MENNIEKYKERAINLHHEGYNCAQSVLLAINPLINLDGETAARISSGLGGGVGASGEICGAANAMAMAESWLHSSAPTDKAKAAADVKPLIKQFSEENNNRICCRDLKGKADARSCDALIAQAVEIFLKHHPELIQPES